MRDTNKTIIQLSLLVLYGVVLGCLALLKPVTFFGVDGVSAIDAVEYIASAKTAPESLPHENWQSVSLPDDWYQSQHKVEQIWYRTTLSVDKQTAKVWAVYLPSVTHNAAVYINGTWIGQGGRFEAPVSRHHNEPLLFSFSSNLLQRGSNQIDIRVKAAYVEQGLFDQFYVAPVDQLIGAYSWKHFARVELIQWLTMALYFMGMIVFMFWLAQPKDFVYGIFALELFLWGTHNLNLFVSDIPIFTRSWEALNISTLGWTVVAMIIFNFHYVGKGSKKVQKLMLVYSALGIGIFFIPDIGDILHIGYSFWDGFLVIIGSYTIYYLVCSYFPTKNTDAYLLMLAGLPILIFGLHDILMINHFSDRRDGLIIQYSVIPSLLLFGWFLLRRFVQAISKAENLAKTLEKRVEQKQQALQVQYEQLNQLEKKQVLADERERIMRDMHDGIGGQLVSIVTLLRDYNEPVFTKVREKVQLSLTDLRLVIDSLDPVLNDLPTLLGMMRVRFVDQLESANIELEWAVTELPEIDNMSPRNILHVMRIVQEAMTNSIKHSGSNRMTLATGVIDNKRIYIDVIDYGCANHAAQTNKSRGITNMHYRAKQLGGELVIKHTETGTSVRLLLDI